MPFEGRENWFWDEITIPDACISWEECFECMYQEIFIWKQGKERGRANICPDCQALMYTTFIIVCSN